jgi:hypothetical protein
MSPGQVIVGLVSSVTMMENWQESRPAPLIASQVTVWEPTGSVVPLGGEQETVAAQVALAVYVATAPQTPLPVVSS